MDENEINNVICKSLYHSEYSFQKNKMNAYKGKKLAERLELFLFTCPFCKHIESMKSKDNRFYCTNCGYDAYYTENGLFINEKRELHFDNPREWNNWQVKELEKLIEKSLNGNSEKILLKNKDAIVYSFTKRNRFKKFYKGTIYFKKEELILDDNKDNLSFIIEKLVGLNIQSNNILEFYYENILYQIKFNDPSSSVYKWMIAIKILGNKKEFEYE